MRVIPNKNQGTQNGTLNEIEINSKNFILSGQYQTKMATVIGIVLCQY